MVYFPRFRNLVLAASTTFSGVNRIFEQVFRGRRGAEPFIGIFAPPHPHSDPSRRGDAASTDTRALTSGGRTLSR